MSAAQLKQAVTGQVAKNDEKPKDIAHLLASPNVMMQIKAALPRHMTAERMARIATTEMRKVPKLGQCDPLSFLGAVIQCAQLGLEPGNALGHAYILPFDKREKQPSGQWKTVRTEAQVIIGYRGMIDLARRSGQIVSIEARAVYEGDKFECTLGLESKLDHTPDWQNANRADASKLRFVYAVAKLKGGGLQFDIMSRSEVESIRARSKAANDGPWVTDFAAMALKTVVRRLFKFLPVSIEMQTAVGLDEMAEQGFSQQNAGVIDGEFTFVDDQAQIETEEVKPTGKKAPAPAVRSVDPETGEVAAPASNAEEKADMKFDEAAFSKALQACTTTDQLDELIDTLRDLAEGDQRDRIGEVYSARRRALS